MSYQYTGKEAHLFDFQPKFRRGDMVRIIRKDLNLHIWNSTYPYDYAWVWDSNQYGKSYDGQNTYRLINEKFILGRAIKRDKIISKFYVNFAEDELELLPMRQQFVRL